MTALRVVKKLSSRSAKKKRGKKCRLAPITEEASTLQAPPSRLRRRASESIPPTLRSGPWPWASWDPGAPTLRTGELLRR